MDNAPTGVMFQKSIHEQMLIVEAKFLMQLLVITLSKCFDNGLQACSKTHKWMNVFHILHLFSVANRFEIERHAISLGGKWSIQLQKAA